jgi:transcriptional regulator with XRE-family HTH domain
MEMGEKIKMLRTQKSMTLEELGDRVGVGKSTVRKWENGMIANMRRDKIAKIANALDCSPAYLLGWEENDESEQLKRLTEYAKRLSNLSQDKQKEVFNFIDFLENKNDD